MFLYRIITLNFPTFLIIIIFIILINYIKVIVVGLSFITSIIIIFFRDFFSIYFNLYNFLLK